LKFQITNPKKTITQAAQAPALRVNPVWNLGFMIYLEFGALNF
jgi:hypothetical protein